MDKKFKQWRKERDEMLEKKSVQELIIFIEKWEKEGFYDNGFSVNFKKANEWVQKATLCKMICNATKVSEETKDWALIELLKMGSSPAIM